ncbi:hypothetical protein F4775DRAFT_591716 [Biscogniauxia sp. FL1348]|nr:hypothetical protein F4775DRAFT_591716 [Biscogniauxia sp. FL1348]
MLLLRDVAILALVALGAAHPQGQVCGVICVDAINDCGIQYGGCYDPCTDPKPVAPPCPSSSSSAPADCPTICVDAINDCGIPYGSCYPICSTQLKPTPPPCPATTTVEARTSPATSCTLTGSICEDYLKSCGTPTPTAVLTWGGCRGVCESPTFTEPDCPTPTPEMTMTIM